ncbi:P-loop NTPase fold protein [Phreatobacter cathodiphilus]|nr:P-loop NTPase fold protein [Phreatobacter cathodiphilus]
MFEADLPIVRPSQDLLDAAAFANRIAASIFSAEGNGGCAIGLVGGWGTGKTSVLNLVERRLALLTTMNSSDAMVRSILGENFIDSVEKLDASYQKYEEILSDDSDLKIYGTYLYSSIYRINILKNRGLSDADARKAEGIWRSIQIASENPSVVFFRFSPWLLGHRVDLTLAYISEVSKSIGSKLGVEAQKAIADYLSAIERISKIAGPLGWIGGVTGTGSIGKYVGLSAKIEAEHFSKGISLEDAKQKLKWNLSKQETKVVIVIDDIDRLAPSEAQLMISLVKSQMDMPNIVHILAYDKKRTEKLLRRRPSRYGDGYIDKIVQVEIELPPPTKARVYEMFAPTIDGLIQKYKTIPSNRMTFVQQDIINSYVENPRDIVRLANSIKFGWPAIENYVDPLDYVVIEVLRLFERDVFNWVRQNIDVINGRRFSSLPDEEWKHEIEQVLARARHDSAARSALRYLFPRIARVTGDGAPGENDDDVIARDAFRVCSQQSSDVYFGLAPQSGAIGHAEVRELRAAVDDPSSLRALLGLVEDSGIETYRAQRIAFLNSLTADANNREALSIGRILNLLEIADQLVLCGDPEPGFFGPIFNGDRIRTILIKYIESLGADTRYGIAAEIMSEGHSLTAVVDLCRSLIGDLRSGGASGRSAFGGAEAQNLRQIVLDRVRRAASEGRFWGQPDPMALLWFWQQAVEDEEVRSWLESQLKSDKILERFMVIAPGMVYSTAGNYRSVRREIWSRIVDIDAVHEKAKIWAAAENEDDDRVKVARAFVEAIARGNDRN